MNLQSIVVVLLRLMALNLVLQAVVSLTPHLLNYMSARSDISFAEAQLLVALPWLIILGLLLSAVLLWVIALPVARLVTRNVAQEISLGALTLADCYSTAFLLIGLYHIVDNFSAVLSWSHFVFVTAAPGSGTAWREDVNFYEVFGSFVPFVVGVVLVVKGRRWAGRLAGGQQMVDNPQAHQNR